MISDILLQRAFRMLRDHRLGPELRRDIEEYLKEFSDVEIDNFEPLRREAHDTLDNIIGTLARGEADFIRRLRNNCLTNTSNAKRVMEIYRYVHKSGYSRERFYSHINYDRHWQYPEHNEDPLPTGRVQC